MSTHTLLREARSEIVALAGDLVSLWESPKIKALPRSDRNAAIEETRERLTVAVQRLRFLQSKDRARASIPVREIPEERHG